MKMSEKGEAHVGSHVCDAAELVGECAHVVVEARHRHVDVVEAAADDQHVRLPRRAAVPQPPHHARKLLLPIHACLHICPPQRCRGLHDASRGLLSLELLILLVGQ